MAGEGNVMSWDMEKSLGQITSEDLGFVQEGIPDGAKENQVYLRDIGRMLTVSQKVRVAPCGRIDFYGLSNITC